ncbi:MAG: ABC transporter ATP-binding protein [Halorhabdus sp.]
MSALLSVDGLRKRFGGVTAVDGAAFDVDAESITGLIGPNGAGKTTTFDLISGFLKPDAGTITFQGTDIWDLMQPSRKERSIWAGSTGVITGTTAVAGASFAGLSAPEVTASAVGGAGLGLAGYVSQHYLRQRYRPPQRTRPSQLSQEGLVRTFQITRELEEMTVLENMLLAPKGQRGESLLGAWFQRDAVRDQDASFREQARDTLEFLEIDHLADQQAGNLSGGQRKLLELGRVLMTDPEMLLLDEPVAGVNPALTDKLLARIEDLQADGYTFLIIEHDMDVIMNISDTIIVMSEGDVLMEGTPDEVRNDDRVINAYLGQE